MNSSSESDDVIRQPREPADAVQGAARPETTPAPRHRDPARPTPSPAPAAGIRVLVVDDHAMVREGLRLLLSIEPGVDVVGQAADGFQAIEMARRLRPDVILMDVSMPRLDGIEATRAICETDPRAAVIGLSAYEDARSRRSMLQAGAVDFVTKGLPPPELMTAIRRAIQKAPSTSL